MSYACFPCESIWTTLFKLMMMMSMIRAIRRGEGRADRGLPHASASHAAALFWTDTILASSARRVTLSRSPAALRDCTVIGTSEAALSFLSAVPVVQQHMGRPSAFSHNAEPSHLRNISRPGGGGSTHSSGSDPG